jgi:hypothetical protein
MGITRVTGTWRFVAVLAAALSTGAAGLRTQAAVPSVTVEEIGRVWKDRESRIKSFEFEWKEADFVPKGTRSFNKVLRYNPIVTTTVAYPPNDTTFNYDRQLKTTGRESRFASVGPNWVPELGEYMPQRHVTVNDSVICKDFFDGDPSGAKQFNAHAYLRDPARDMTTRQLEVLPILLCYRPFACVLDHTGLSRYSLSAIVATDAQGECLVLTRALQGGVKHTLWIDPKDEYLPVRWQMAMQGHTGVQLRLLYAREGAERSVPSGWERTIYAQPAEGEAIGTVQDESRAHVTAYAFNKAIPASDFDVDLAAGTWVTDERSGEDYILREGGRKRIITREELAAGYSYEQYAATESGKAGEADATLAERPWFVGGVAVAVLAALGILIFRRVRGLHRQGASRPRVWTK